MNSSLPLPWFQRAITGLLSSFSRWLQPAQDLHELARRVEAEMPGVAAELRIIAQHRREAPE